jgi:hypothetical protein
VSATTEDKWLDDAGTTDAGTTTGWLGAIDDPDFRIRICRGAWQRAGNPFFVWGAVAVCTEHKKPFPDWVMGYLRDVAQRMTSDDAAAATDLRAVLPGIMGFPTKPGPGHPLARDKDDALLFAGWFAIEIVDRGLEPTEALRKAAERLPPEAADRDEKTLWRWLMKAVDLKRRPSTNAQWRAALRNRYGVFTTFALLDTVKKIRGDSGLDKVSRDSG